MNNKEITIDQLLESLPYGSGFDAKWNHDHTFKNGKLLITSGYHNMNEHGYYDGWTNLRLTINLDDLLGFRLQLSGKKRYTQRHDRDYLEETIHYTLSQLLDLDDQKIVIIED